MLGIIGGSGLTALSGLERMRRKSLRTPYGEPSAAPVTGMLQGREVVFLARHGDGHTIPPHEINYRANLWALQALGVSSVVAVATVGGIRSDLVPGALVVPDQVIDYTYGRAATFYTRADLGLRHVDFTLPYSQPLRAACLAAARRQGVTMIDGGVYAATQGPRLETAAEIRRLERDGADMVGMTGMPEAALARELELDYAAIAVIANHAAGRASSLQGITLNGIGAVLEPAMDRVRLVLASLVATHGGCREVLRMGDARLLQRARPVEAFDTPELHALLSDMHDTMRALDGAGLAAPQIGVGLQVVIFEVAGNPRYPDAEAVPYTALINPVLKRLDEEMEEGWEGCLSVPGMRGVVARYRRLRYRGFDQYGKPIDRSVEGFHARVVQHECDHLIGVLYPMRIRDFTRFGFTDVLFPGTAMVDE